MGIINNLENEIEEIKQEMCDKYCRHPRECSDPDEWENISQEICGNCPLTKL